MLLLEGINIFDVYIWRECIHLSALEPDMHILTHLLNYVALFSDCGHDKAWLTPSIAFPYLTTTHPARQARSLGAAFTV